MVDQMYIQKGVSAWDVLWRISQAMHYHNTLSKLRGDTVEVSSKQLVINTPCQTGIGVFVEISKQAVRYQDTLSNRHRNDCWNFQGSSAACSNVIWGRHRTPRHLAGKLVFSRMLHLCPFTIRTPATLNRSPTRKWKIEFLESQIFSRLKKRLRGSEKMWILLREECQTSEPLQLNTFAASLFRRSLSLLAPYIRSSLAQKMFTFPRYFAAVAWLVLLPLPR